MTSDSTQPAPTSATTSARHLGMFVVAGLTAFAVDAAVLEVLTRGGGVDPLLARVPSVLLAMTVSWWINRTFTFAVRQPASLAEFMRFAAVASGSNITNYAVYSALLLSGLVSWPLIALVIASAFAMAFSYAGMRFAVFRAGERSR